MHAIKRGMIVTIDGPAASGKSTTAKRVAEKLGWLYLDTGAMYRALTVKVLREKLSLDDTAKIGTLAETVKIELIPSRNSTKVLLDGEEVTQDIRHPDVDKAVGPVCEIPRVRDVMVALQRNMAKEGNIVAEGRDMGTVVFPEAAYKFYMVASIEGRAKRRRKDLVAQGIDVSISKLKHEIEERDRRDSRRTISPLKRAKDAILIDTTRMDIPEQVAFVVDHIKKDSE